MLPEDGHSESVREDKPVIEGVRDAPGEEGARASAPKLDDIRIDGRIGTDPEELKHWAAHVVAGNPIEHMEIADLRALIEAVQEHPEARLVPERGESDEEIDELTRLEISGGRVLSVECQGLQIRVSLVAETAFAQRAHFAHASFLGGASFENAVFQELAWFEGAHFESEAIFRMASFERDARFVEAVFDGSRITRQRPLKKKRRASSRGQRESATFDAATFKGPASFRESVFLGQASFVDTIFMSAALFGRALFRENPWFSHTTFADNALFAGAAFGNGAQFEDSNIAGPLTFDHAVFEGPVSFERSVLGGETSFAGTVVASEVSFEDLVLNGDVLGDFRSMDVSRARAVLIDTRRRHSPWVVIGAWQERESRLASLIAAHREKPWERLDPVPGMLYRACRAAARPAVVLRELWGMHRENRAFWRVLRQMVRERLVHGAVGWNLVRALGRLSILNRVSLVALIAVPVLAAGYIAAQKIVAESEGEQVPIWIRWVARAIGGSPHLSETLALAFFASVLVTLGLLVYQTFAPDTIKLRDEDEHVRDLETRYSDEKSSLRGDGLRRSIERLEDQAKVRPNRHPSFVKHHGDLIWIPPRDKPEWFKDDDLEEEPFRARAREALHESRERLGQPTDDASLDEARKTLDIIPPKQRSGFVPGAERARICIEEGARAEYWLKAHEKIGWAWVSLVCYLLGIAILLVILFIQCRSVARAAWWPEATHHATRSTG